MVKKACSLVLSQIQLYLMDHSHTVDNKELLQLISPLQSIKPSQ